VLVVSEIGCRYKSPYRYDDEVLIRTWIDDGSSRLMRSGTASSTPQARSYGRRLQ